MAEKLAALEEEIRITFMVLPVTVPDVRMVKELVTVRIIKGLFVRCHLLMFYGIKGFTSVFSVLRSLC